MNNNSCGNNPPSANAGSDVSITLPQSVAYTSGASAWDTSGSFTVSWSGGPVAGGGNTISPTFGNFSTPGTYTYTLTVTDGLGSSRFDSMNVTVNPAPSYSCSPAPGNAYLYGGANSNPPSNMSSVYSSSDTGAYCEFNCNAGYGWNGSSCSLPDLTAQAVTPSNGSSFTTASGIYFEGRAANSSGVPVNNGGWGDVVIDWYCDWSDNVRMNGFGGGQMGYFSAWQQKTLSASIGAGSAPVGNHCYYIHVDTDGSGVSESNEGNNTSSRVNFSVVNAAPVGPNVSFSSAPSISPGNAQPGDTITINTGVIRNDGTQASGGHNLEIRIDTNNDGNPNVSLPYIWIPALNPGQTYDTGSQSWQIPASLGNNTTVRVGGQADVASNVSELNEGDNWSGWTGSVFVTVPPPGAPTVSLSANTTNVSVNDWIELTWIVSGADSCTASNSTGDSNWTGAKSAFSDTQWVQPQYSGSYSIQCWNGGTPSVVATEWITVNTQCSDGSDNDSDGLTDMSDPGCSGPGDTDESNGPVPQCSDGSDNDSDGLTDMSDPGCSGPGDTDESNGPVPQCSDGSDNDSDGLTDMSDPGCSGPGDTDESNAPPPSGCPSGPVSAAPECDAPGGASAGASVSATCSSGYSGSGCNLTCDLGGSGVWGVDSSNCNAPTIDRIEICDQSGANCTPGPVTFPASPASPNPPTIKRICWEVSNATDCSVSKNPNGDFSSNGGLTNGCDDVAVTRSFNASHEYELMCTVGATPINAVRPSLTINTGAGAPTLTVRQGGSLVSTVEMGSSVTVEWSANNGDEKTCSLVGGGLNNGVGTLDGGGTVDTGTTPPITIEGRTTFRMDCGGLIGTRTVEVVPIGWES